MWKRAPAGISVAFKPLQTWASSLCVSRMGQICVGNNWGVDMIEVGGTVSCCNVSWHDHIISCLNETFTKSPVTTRSVLLCYNTAKPFHCSLSVSSSSQAVCLGRHNNGTWRSAAVLRCVAGVMSQCRAAISMVLPLCNGRNVKILLKQNSVVVNSAVYPAVSISILN
jgi:hypothetical protein